MWLKEMVLVTLLVVMLVKIHETAAAPQAQSEASNIKSSAKEGSGGSSEFTSSPGGGKAKEVKGKEGAKEGGKEATKDPKSGGAAAKKGKTFV